MELENGLEICAATRGSGIALIWIWNHWERQRERLEGRKPAHSQGVSMVNQPFGGEGVVLTVQRWMAVT